MEQGRATSVICLDFCEASDIVPRHILLSGLIWVLKGGIYDGQEDVVNESTSKQRQVMSSIPQGSALGLVLLGLFINKKDGCIECTLSKSSSTADGTEGRDAILMDLDRLEKQAHRNLMRFGESKLSHCFFIREVLQPAL